MKQLITGPTRVTATSETLIDVIATSNSALVTDSGVVKTHISDHYLVYVVLNLKAPKPLPTYVISRSYKNYDSESFDLAQVPWYENAFMDDAGEKVVHFNEKFVFQEASSSPGPERAGEQAATVEGVRIHEFITFYQNGQNA